MDSSAKPFLLPHAAAGAAATASSKPRKPSASASKLSAGRLHPPTSKITTPSRTYSEKKTDIEPAVLHLQGLPSPKSGEKSAGRHEALSKEKAVVKDETSKNENALAADEDLQDEKVGIEDEALKEEKAVAEDKPVGEKLSTVYIDEAYDASSLLQEIKQTDIAEKEKTEGRDCAENEDALAEKEEKKVDSAETYATENRKESLVAADIRKDGVPFDKNERDAVPSVLEKEDTDTHNFWKLPAQQNPSSSVAETKIIVYSEQNHNLSACIGPTVPECLKQMGGDLNAKQSGGGLIFTEHLDSEQEGFLFAKGEPIFEESTQSSKSLPAVACSTLKKLKEQDVSSLSQFEAAGIAASDMKAAPSATELDLACKGIFSMPTSEDKGSMEAAMATIAEDVLVKCPLQPMSVARRPALSCSWKLSSVIAPLVVVALLCVLCFASAVTQDEGSYLHPT